MPADHKRQQVNQKEDDNMKDSQWIQALEEIKLSEKTKEKLVERCMSRQHSANLLMRYSKTAAIFLCVMLALAVCCPVCAAYHLYRTKNINVYFNNDITEEQIEEIGEALEQMEGVYSVRFVTSEEAWDVFQNNYFTDEYAYLRDMFTENPLISSFNYHVTVRLDADENQIREEVEKLDGVRKVRGQDQE